ncbi:DUF4738 domain-containing protein [Algibacter sp. L3A6]|uniref:DUF4738 domain-containing protein n=1 Tax=Algibacter sp. L3A6 TaxID=2686366 RepID=UPI00131B344B|nr:DUF4738 domain-containing protein [Algibacter sp. L3A6]
MKQLLILIFIFLILSGCDWKKNDKNQSEFESTTDFKIETELKAKDTTVVYWETGFDTIQNVQDIYIGNDKHRLEIKSYSLNDSSIVNINDNFKEIYHDCASQIILTNKKDTILKAILNKRIFKDSLNSEFYRRCVLSTVEYDGIRSNRLFFKGGLFVPDTDRVFGNEFAIFYRTEKKNQIESWNYEDLGL